MRRGWYDSWELLQPSPIFSVHAALLNTGHVLLFSGATENADRVAYPLEARVWDPASRQIMPGIIPLPEDLFCSGHTFLSDGRLLVIGGDTTPTGQGHSNNRCYIFTPNTASPDSGTFSPTASMAHARWYPTALALNDGRVLAFSGGQPPCGEVEVLRWRMVAPYQEQIAHSMNCIPACTFFPRVRFFIPAPGGLRPQEP